MTLSPQHGEEELNAFLRGHRVISIERYLVQSDVPHWAVLVEYSDKEARNSPNDGFPTRRGKTDATSNLNADELERYEKYRKIRAEVARNADVPAYVVFSNEELAILSRIPMLTNDISPRGIAPSRLSNYLKYFVEQSNDAIDETCGTADAADCGA